MSAQVYQQDIPLYDGAVPGAIAADRTEFIAKEPTGGRSIVAADVPALTMVAPAADKRTGMAVIICPGGGYERLSIDKEGFDVARRLATQGITAFVLKYRMPQRSHMEKPSSGPLQDARQAMSVVRCHANEWALNPRQIGIIGFSAGGHVAASLATLHYSEPALRPDFQVLLYPVITMSASLTHAGSRKALLGNYPDDTSVNTFSLEKQVTTATPPAFLLHAKDDNAVPVENTLMYAQALKDKQVPVYTLLLDEGGHGFGMLHPTDWFVTVLEWLKTQER